MGKSTGVKLTKTLVAELAARPEGEYWVWDSVLPGFGVRVSASGRRVYTIRYRTRSGMPRKLAIGQVEILTPEDAREQARLALVQVAMGGDPALERQQRRAGATVADLAAAYTEYQQPRVKASTAKINASLWSCHILPALGRRKAADVGKADFMALHTKVGRTHPIAANSVVILARGAFEWAEAVGMIPKDTNPAKGIDLFPTRCRQTILSPEQIAALGVAVGVYTKGFSWSAVWAIRLLLVTGLRKTEWTKSRWEWIDWEACTLSLPDSKSGARTVLLSDVAMDILRDLRKRTNSEWIIPGADPSKPLSTLDRHWRALKKMAGIPQNVRIHDLRHTFGSYAHRTGISQKGVGELLGHKRMSTSERYIHAFDADKRENARRASASILSGK